MIIITIQGMNYISVLYLWRLLSARCDSM